MTAPRIDAHQHFWRYSPATHGWIDDSMPQLKRDFAPDDLAPLLEGARMDACVAVQAEQSIAETEWLLDLADEHAFIAGVVGWVDLTSPRLREDLARFAAGKKLRGVRHIAQDEPDDRWLARPGVIRGIGMLAEFGLAYDVLVYARQLPAAIELVRALPEQRFVLDHIGKPAVREREIAGWARDIEALAGNENAWCKLSGLVTEGDWQRWSAEDFAPYAKVVLEWFGAGRVMFGSDWPVCTQAASYERVVDLAERLTSSRPQEERDAIFGSNAAEFYRLDVAS